MFQGRPQRRVSMPVVVIGIVGLMVTLVLLGCINDDLQSEFTVVEPTPAMRPYQSDSPHFNDLFTCSGLSGSPVCTFDQLPLIGMETEEPTIDDLLNRVVISHEWMGDNLWAGLLAMPDETQRDILILARSITSIVISYDIRPSTYSSSRSRISLDPKFLWLTAAEKATISSIPDYRSSFADDLRFIIPKRYVIGNQPAYDAGSLLDSEDRSLGDMSLFLARVLFHELAHANDYFPPALIEDIDRSSTPFQIRSQHLSDEAWVSQRLNCTPASESASTLERYCDPLDSQLMDRYAGIRYHGQTADEAAKAWRAETLNLEFAIDGATDSYNYTTDREDVAKIFEAVMMKYHFGADNDVAFINLLPGEQRSCSVCTVHWGERGRIGSPSVKGRAQFVMRQIMPNKGFSTFFDGLPAATSLPSGCSWEEALDPTEVCPGAFLDRRARRMGAAALRRIEIDLLPIDRPAE